MGSEHYRLPLSDGVRYSILTTSKNPTTKSVLLSFVTDGLDLTTGTGEFYWLSCSSERKIAKEGRKRDNRHGAQDSALAVLSKHFHNKLSLLLNYSLPTQQPSHPQYDVQSTQQTSYTD